jgi:plasmid stability protein
MATLYVENVPDELYEALRKRAKQNRKSIAGEVISLLEETLPTAAELKRRQKFLDYVLQLKKNSPPALGPFPPTEEMQREDREN